MSTQERRNLQMSREAAAAAAHGHDDLIQFVTALADRRQMGAADGYTHRSPIQQDRELREALLVV